MNSHVVPGVPREMWLAVIAAILSWSVWAIGGLGFLDRPTGDLLLRSRGGISSLTTEIAAVVIDDESLDRLGKLPWPRSRLADLVTATRRLGAEAVVVDVILAEPGPEPGDASLELALDQGPSILAAVLLPTGGWALPLDRFGGSSRAAHVHAELSGDGVVRSVSATKQASGLSLPALSIAAARLAGWPGAVTPGEVIRPDFRIRPDSIPQINALEILGGSTTNVRLTGRVVLIGPTASGAGDQFVVPVKKRSRPTPGVLVHAATADAIVRGGLLHPAPGWAVLLASLAVALITQLARTRSGRFGLGWAAAVAATIVALCLVPLWWLGLQFPMGTLMVAAIVSAVGREALESLEAQRETSKVLAALLDVPPGEAAKISPGGVAGRLQLARSLQRQIARDGELRRVLLDGLHEGVILWDPSGRPLLSNKATERCWGRTPSQEELAAFIGHSIEEGSVDLVVGRRQLQLDVRPIAGGILGLMRDVTAERELEESRRSTQRMVSHELKTPLSSISGFGAMIERYELSREEQLRVAGMIRSEADRLGDMVRTFLDIERLGAGRWEDTTDAVDLGELALERCEFLQSAAKEAGQTLEGSASGSVAVRGSGELLTRLIDNLVGNAIKFSSPAAETRVSVRRENGAVRLEVADTGTGIDGESLPHLFDRFYRVPGTASGGSGLGLALVQEIADWHVASVRVESELGRGTTFTVEFKASSNPGRDDAFENPGR